MIPPPRVQPPTVPPFDYQSVGEHSPEVRVAAGAAPLDETDTELDDKRLATAHERFRRIVSSESDWRTKAEKELTFVDGLDHWDETMKAERRGLPCLSFDRISPACKQVINAAKQDPPEPTFSPVGEGADKETAELLQGMQRNIEQDSGADIAYMTAYTHAVKIGRGWGRVLFEYENDYSDSDDFLKTAFLQKITIKRVPNPFSVYPDPGTNEMDYRDMRYCFVTEDVEKEVFEELHPDADSSSSDFTGPGDHMRAEWFPNGAIRVAEYWWVETSYRDVFMGSDGNAYRDQLPENVQRVGHRKAPVRKVWMWKITGNEILEKTLWPGSYIPLIPCLGEEIIVKAKRELRGMIRPAMDANLSYDYLRSRQVQVVGLSSMANWLMAAGQDEGFETEYAEANRKPYGTLHYRIEVDGKLVPPPQRVHVEADIQGITVGVQAADQDIKNTTETYNPSLGDPQGEESGRAIGLRQRQADNAHFGYHDNLGIFMRHVGRVVLDLMPHVYTEDRIVTVFNPDGKSRQVRINGPTIWEGVEKIFRVGKGQNPARFDVTISSMPSYKSRRDQGKAALLELTRMMPQVMVRAADKVVLALDIPDGDAIADRVRPPDIPPEDESQMSPAALSLQLQQQGAMMQRMTQELQKVTRDLETQRLKLESAERIALRHDVAGILEAELKAKAAQVQQLVDKDFAATEHRLDLLHDQSPIGEDQQPGQPSQAAPPAPAGPSAVSPAPQQ